VYGERQITGLTPTGYDEIAEDDVALAQRKILNFKGEDFNVTDDAGTLSTDVELADELFGLHRVNIPGQTTYGTGVEMTPGPDALAYLVGDRNYNYTVDIGFFGLKLLTLPPAVHFGGVQTAQQNMNFLGGGFLFWNNATLRNDPSIAAMTLSGLYALASQPTYRADTLNATMAGAAYDLFSSPVFEGVSGATLAASGFGAASVVSNMTINSGVTSFLSRKGFTYNDVVGTGIGVSPTQTLLSQTAVDVAPLVNARNNCAISLGYGAFTHPTGNFAVHQATEDPWVVNGAVSNKIRTITASRALDSTDNTIICAASSTIQLTLPLSSTCSGREYECYLASAASVSILVTAPDALNGVTTNPAYSMTTPTSFMTVRSNGSGWAITKAGIAPAVTLGSELILNGTFAGSTNWTGTGWTIGAPAGLATTTANSSALVQTSAAFVANATYRLVYTVSGYSAGTIEPRFGGTLYLYTLRSADGTYTEDVTITGTAPTQFRFSVVGFTGSVSAVSIKQVTGL
jgi:hypothetical protein